MESLKHLEHIEGDYYKGKDTNSLYLLLNGKLVCLSTYCADDQVQNRIAWDNILVGEGWGRYAAGYMNGETFLKVEDNDLLLTNRQRSIHCPKNGIDLAKTVAWLQKPVLTAQDFKSWLTVARLPDGHIMCKDDKTILLLLNGHDLVLGLIELGKWVPHP